ncbi:MAG: hypothetical protein QOD70_605 [Frankiales bacterium]|nr:hypothetical protein [Frankiales bacterium]
MKRWALLVVAAVGVVGVYLSVRAVELMSTGTVTGVLFGVGVLLLVVLGGVLVLGEVRLAAASQRLGERLFAEGFVEEDLPTLPSGRVQRDAADALFERRRTEVETAPEDWRSWFKLATAYDAARDPARGRRAMRKAIVLERASRS